MSLVEILSAPKLLAPHLPLSYRPSTNSDSNEANSIIAASPGFYLQWIGSTVRTQHTPQTWVLYPLTSCCLRFISDPLTMISTPNVLSGLKTRDLRTRCSGCEVVTEEIKMLSELGLKTRISYSSWASHRPALDGLSELRGVDTLTATLVTSAIFETSLALYEKFKSREATDAHTSQSSRSLPNGLTSSHAIEECELYRETVATERS